MESKENNTRVLLKYTYLIIKAYSFKERTQTIYNKIKTLLKFYLILFDYSLYFNCAERAVKTGRECG